MELLLGIAAAVLAAGVLYQQRGLRRDRRRFAAAGELVDVGGHRLHVVCSGRGEQTVVLEAGVAASSLSWVKVQPAVAAFARVCAYDRAGLAWSERSPRPLTFERIVDDLEIVVDRVAAAGGRVVLVGHSFGSFVVRAYAQRHPGRVTGLVLVDPAVEWLTSTPERLRMLRGAQHLSGIGALLAHAGVVRACLSLLTGGAPGAPRRFVRVFGPTAAATLERLVGEVRKLPPEVHPLVQAHWCQPKCFRAMADHLRALERGAAAIAAVHLPPELPVVVISRGDQAPEQLAAQRALAEAAAEGRHIVANSSTHWIQFDEPELIVDAVRSVMRDR